MADEGESTEIDGGHAVRAEAPRDARAVASRRGAPRRGWRVVGAGAGALVLAAGFMVGSVASTPWNDFSQHPTFTAPVETEPLELGVVGGASPTGPTSIDQLLGVIEDAELAALESGRELGPEVQQAAAELGALLTTYVAQQQADHVPGLGDLDLPQAPDPATPAVPDEIPPAGPPSSDDQHLDPPESTPGDPLRPPAEAMPTPSPSPSHAPAPSASAAPSAEPSVAPEPSAAPDDDADVLQAGGPRGPVDDAPAEVDDLAPLPQEVGTFQGAGLQLPTWEGLVGGDGTFQVGNGFDQDVATDDETTSDAGLELAHAEDGEEHDHAHGDERITFDDIVVAATHLASLLNPATASVVVDVRPAVTQLPDGSFVSDDGVAVASNGLPLASGAAGSGSLSATLQAVVGQHASSTAGYSNGRIPTSVLCSITTAPGHMLRCDAAAQFAALNAEYRDRFGVDIPLTDSYRSYDAQVAVRAAKPHLAAVPGTSNHGWGLALDLSTPISGGHSAEYVWLRVHAPDFGWDNPVWARPNGSKPEPWHWEFFAAGPVPDRATSHADVTTAGGSGSSGGSSTGSGSSKGSGAKAPSGKGDGGAKGTSQGDTTGKGSKGDKADGEKPKPKPTPKPSTSPSPKPSASPSPSPKPSAEPEPSTSPSPKPSASPSPSPKPSAEPEPSTSPSPEPSASPSPGTDSSPEPSSEPSPTAGAGDEGSTELSDPESSSTETSGTESSSSTTSSTESSSTESSTATSSTESSTSGEDATAPTGDSEVAQREDEMLGSRTDGSGDEGDALPSGDGDDSSGDGSVDSTDDGAVAYGADGTE
ncbi:M15 family metallopeptidase [Isoptericola sp. AK164]|uniref:M15 family metallopeptidase n=1 Tax=Isoptericola sp. AK164 TaxID=3024246 RepID=UPI0024183212|nr:M15 family metallopeptidase [Isoptericola sp. AK164]